MVESNKPPSMRDFDYFSDKARPSAVSDAAAALPESLEEELLAWQRRRRRAGLAAVTATLVVAASSWFLWGYRDALAYSFSEQRPPLVLGDVVELTPKDVAHNSYVELTGITEHRGLVQKVTRGLWPIREERWYFRLVGSRGIFIETPPDAQRYGFATQVTVIGRAVDPERDPTYGHFLTEYRERFSAEQPFARVIQVEKRPGEGRLPFIVFGLFISAIAAFDAWTLWSYARYSRKRSGLMR